MKVKIKRFDKTIPLPRYENLAAGFDFYAKENVTIQPKETRAIPGNIALEIPKGYFLLLVPRSSTPRRFGLTMPYGAGIIDPFYNGDDNEVMLGMYNFTNKVAHVKKKDKIAQGILMKYEHAEFEEVKKLNGTKRRRWRA
jgi:dUTP pyrophosphatase